MTQASRRTGSIRWAVAIAAAVGLAAALWWTLGTSDEVGDVAKSDLPAATEGFYELGKPTEGLDIGQLAPELLGDSGADAIVTDVDGNQITLAALRGRPVWIVFWATWCPPCQSETPDLQRAYEDYADEGLELIAIDVQEPAEVVADYAKTYGLTYTAALDPSAEIFRKYGVFGLPTHYFIDREGVIRERVYGPMTYPQMEERLASILGD